MIDNLTMDYGVYLTALVLGLSPLWFCLLLWFFKIRNKKIIIICAVISVFFLFYIFVSGLFLHAYFLPWNSWS